MKKARTGAETQSAVPSECPSAMPFGTSSPITTWKKVRISIGEYDRAQRRDQRVELLRERVLAERADAQRGERDAELHRGDEPRRVRQ